MRPGFSSDIPLLHTVQQQGLPIPQKPYSPRDLGRKVREMLDLPVANLSHRHSSFDTLLPVLMLGL
jgi:hypothetical protein